jgi:predicted ATPase/class 3 adenylate cyclase
MSDRQQLEQAIAAQESLRGIVDDAIIDTTVAALRRQLESLETATEPESRRVLATILFMDLAGHTQLVHSRDPEEIMEIIDRALQRLAGAVTHHGGRIARYQGDGFKAVFGLPLARENDPDSAVRTGLDILAIAGEIAVELENERQLPGFQVRVGIDTGLVLAGGGTEGEDAVTGLPVNLAARLESAAAPGTVLISHHTYQHIRNVFDVEPLPAILAKGFDEPVPVFRVLRAKPRSFRTRRRGIEGVTTRMIGRDVELRTLQDEFGRVIDKRESRVVLVVGDAGMGKSRLLYEFENWADRQPPTMQLYRGRARLETQSSPFGLLREVFAFRWAILDDDPVPVVTAKIQTGIRDVLGASEAEMKAHLIGHLLGYDFAASPYVRPLLANPGQLRSQALFYTVEYFKAAAARDPLAIFLEDLHWADDSTLEVIETLVEVMAGRPLLILGATRPALFERRPDWLAGCHFLRRVDLALLDRTASTQLVTEILQKVPAVPGQLRDLVVNRAEGNPFYIEELIKTMIDEGIIHKDEEIWSVSTDRLAEVHLPPTLAGILQARLDGLPQPEKETLQRAAVVGRRFWNAAVEAMAKTDVDKPEARIWTALQQREIIFHSEETAFEGTDEYVFRHALLRDVAYESVLKRRRRAYHQRVAEWLIRAGGVRVDEYAGQIAGHFALAEENESEATWRFQAGKQAASRYALAEALAEFNRALILTPTGAVDSRFALLAEVEKIYHTQGRRELQSAILAEMDTIAIHGTVEQKLAVTLKRAKYEMVTGNLAASADLAQQVIRLAQDSDHLQEEVSGHLILGQCRWQQGDYGPAEAEVKLALQQARSIGDLDSEQEALRTLGIVAEERGDFTAQEQYFEQVLQLAHRSHNLWAERRALNSLGVAAQARADYYGALAFLDQSLNLAREIGDRQGEGVVLGNIGSVLAEIGHLETAVSMQRQALAIAEEIKDVFGRTNSLFNLGALGLMMNDLETAGDYLARALELAEATGDRLTVGYSLNELGHLALADDRLAEAAGWFRRALDLRQELEQHFLALESEAGLAAARLARGEGEEARQTIAEVLAFIESGGLEGSGAFRPAALAIRVLRETGDPRFPDVLAQTCDLLQSRAGSLTETDRRLFLENIPWNREIVEAWEDSGRIAPSR